MQYVTTAERIGIQKGEVIGIQKGEAIGIQKGEYAMLMRLLQRKFHTIPDVYQSKLKNADADRLLCWSERIFAAKNIEEIFAEG